jgi:hypothetical protein
MFPLRTKYRTILELTAAQIGQEVINKYWQLQIIKAKSK